MIESAAAQWKPRKAWKPSRIFSLLNKPLDPLNKQPPEGPHRTDGNKKMSIKAPCPTHFSKIENSTGDPSPTPYKTSLFTEQTNRK